MGVAVTAGFNIALPGQRADLDRDRAVQRPETPPLSPIGIYDLARLYREDRETALKLAGENAEQYWRMKP